MIKCFYCGTENSETDKFCRQCGNSLQTAVTGNKPDADIELLSSYLAPKFTIEKKIGKGGMATVYLGEQTALQRKILETCTLYVPELSLPSLTISLGVICTKVLCLKPETLPTALRR